MIIDLRVEKLVLEGLDPLQARALQLALRERLAAVMAAHDWPADARHLRVAPLQIELHPPFDAARAADRIAAQLVDAAEARA